VHISITPELVIAIALILLVSFPVHEFSHAYAAYRLGDGTAKLMGRLTLNPVAHFDPFGALFLIVSALLGRGIGWAKPTPVNPQMVRHGSVGLAIVAFAGPASNLIIAALMALPLRYILHSSQFLDVPQMALGIMAFFVQINLALFVFNLIPAPPLDGSQILLAALDPSTRYSLGPALMQYGPLILLVLVFTGVLGVVLGPVIDALYRILVGF
jgi:Zn-dependent protease